MGYALRPDRRLQREVRRVANERLGGAIEQLDQRHRRRHPIPSTSRRSSTTFGSDARRHAAWHGWSSRPWATSSGPSTGRSAMPRTSCRHFATPTPSSEPSTRCWRHDPTTTSCRRCAIAKQPWSVGASHSAGTDGDVRMATARAKLTEARTMSQHWKLPHGADTLESGIAATYRQGRTALRRVRSDPTDHRLHEWRKAVKYLWYQMQLVHDAAPSVLGPLVDELDQLAEALGDDHDLTVLVELLEAGSGSIHSPSEVGHVCELARQRQAVLRDRRRAFGGHDLRRTATAHSPIGSGSYWHLAVDLGPERQPRRAGGASRAAGPVARRTRAQVRRSTHLRSRRSPAEVSSSARATSPATSDGRYESATPVSRAAPSRSRRARAPSERSSSGRSTAGSSMQHGRTPPVDESRRHATGSPPATM